MASRVAEKIPGWFTRVLLPQIQEMKGELKAINARIEGLDGKLDSAKSELGSRIQYTNERIDSLRNELKSDIGKVDSSVKDLDK
ncbi:MAG: hypothetical protein ACRECH_15630 [Nitrososphaerales archaeon]